MSKSWPLTVILGRVERQVSRKVDEALSPEGLSVDQWRVLSLLADGQGHPMSAIAAHITVPGATLTKLADRLVDAALVYRLVDETDRRRVLVYRSPLGAELYLRLRPDVEAIEADILGALGDEAEELVPLLNRLIPATRPDPVATAR